MKILVFTYEYPPVGGGGGRVAQDICWGLVKHGHDVRVLTTHWGELPSTEVQNGVHIQRVSTGRKLSYRAGFMDMGRYIPASVLAARRTIRDWRPDILHVHFAVPSGPAAWVISKMSGIPYVLTAHLGDVPGGVPQKTKHWFRLVLPFTPPIWQDAARVAAVSEFTRILAIKHYAVPIEVVPNGVNLDLLDPGEIRANAVPRIVFAGRFMTQKNPIQIVRTLANLRDLPWECVMLGDGPLKADVEEEISRLKLTDRFFLSGWVTPDQVIDWYRKSDILFMPSRSEGLPVAGVQALSMGLALVLSRVGGCGDLIEQGKNGFLLDRDDLVGFEESMKIILSDPEKLQACRVASRQLAAKFDTEIVVESYVKIFTEVVQGNNALRPEENM
jgi:L-malate glycosyltransferase